MMRLNDTALLTAHYGGDKRLGWLLVTMVMVMVASAGVMGEHCHMFPPAQVLTSSHPASSKILSEVLLSHKLLVVGQFEAIKNLWQTWCLFVP